MAEGLKRVLLFSTGLDSFVLSRLIPYDVLLFVRTGTQDNRLEMQRLEQFHDARIHTVDLSFLVQFELPNKIIPFRNHILTCVAAQFGHEIHMASTLGDTTRDKDEHFARDMSTALSWFSLGPHEKTVFPGPRQIVLPLREKTKRELVADYLAQGHPWIDLVERSVSCYMPTAAGQECGQCRSCIRKYVALKGNHITPRYTVSAELLAAHLEEAKRKCRHPREIRDIEEVLCTTAR